MRKKTILFLLIVIALPIACSIRCTNDGEKKLSDDQRRHLFAMLKYEMGDAIAIRIINSSGEIVFDTSLFDEVAAKWGLSPPPPADFGDFRGSRVNKYEIVGFGQIEIPSKVPVRLTPERAAWFYRWLEEATDTLDTLLEGDR